MKTYLHQDFHNAEKLVIVCKKNYFCKYRKIYSKLFLKSHLDENFEILIIWHSTSPNFEILNFWILKLIIIQESLPENEVLKNGIQIFELKLMILIDW